MTKLKSNLKFLKELPKNFDSIGAVFPSSRSLARDLIKPLSTLPGPRKILEVGAGTGAITGELVKNIRSSDRLLICEINPRLMYTLQRELKRNATFSQVEEQIEFLCCPVQELRDREPAHSFDLIVSSLPFANFSSQLVGEILDLYEHLLIRGGILTFFEYVFLKRAGQLYRSESERSRIREVDEVLRKWRQKREANGKLSSRITLLNIPPARTVEVSF